MINLKEIFAGAASHKTRTVAAVLTGLALIFTGHTYVGSDQFGLRTTLGVASDKTLPPNLYLHVPLLQYTHNYQANTQRIEFRAGGMRWVPFTASTNDQNVLTANLALNYRVTQDPEKLALHRWAMDGYFMPDGYFLLTGLLNDSVNAVMGQQSLAKTINDPKAFTDAVRADLAFRIEQNNVPVQIESLELHSFDTSMRSSHINSYEVSKDQPQP